MLKLIYFWLFLAIICSLQVSLAGDDDSGDDDDTEIDYDGASIPGGAGHALQFSDHVIVKTDFTDFPTDELTFEVWISTSDFCHPSSILSYAVNSDSSDTDQRVTDFNSLVVFNPKDILLCHDFEYMILEPDPDNKSCASQFSKTNYDDASVVDRKNKWRHLAATWKAEDDGEVLIYVDGKLRSKATTKHTKPLKSNGAVMIGGDQDCFGGCSDAHQGFYGAMDEMKLWRRAKSATEILRDMRRSDIEKDGDSDLVAYYKFDEPKQEYVGQAHYHRRALDSSGNNNDLMLVNYPKVARNTYIKGQKSGDSLDTASLFFQNNYAGSNFVQDMPEEDFTVEFWARTEPYRREGQSGKTPQEQTELFSYSTDNIKGSGENTVFLDDAIRIGKYLTQYQNLYGLYDEEVTSTVGSISVKINSNQQGNGRYFDNWIDFKCDWVDDEWHHVAVTWKAKSGEVQLYFDGDKKSPFWKSSHGSMIRSSGFVKEVTNKLAEGTKRKSKGSLFLGQNQECYGGCFIPNQALIGDMAVVRIWNKVRSQSEIKDSMYRIQPKKDDGLVSLYNMNVTRKNGDDFKRVLLDDRGTNNLYLGSTPPVYILSTAPLEDKDRKPVAKPEAGKAGHSLRLHDQQVALVADFKGFPETELTVEFWMMSVDTCRQGVPFSYAMGDYKDQDNTFLIFNYNNWGIAINEAEGNRSEHNAGFSSTDGKWHYIAVTWEMESGETKLYDNGHLMWTVNRSKGVPIKSGGTLVLGREQDCLGGCFDSAEGAKGKIQEVSDQEYGPQDFFGVLENVRIWDRVLSRDELYDNMRMDDGSYTSNKKKYGSFNKPGVNPHQDGLIAYWKFDEGEGYKVEDSSGHNHDLQLLEEPTWEVTRWLSLCGDGHVEGAEECDDFNTQDGDGCSSQCKIEKGWKCITMSYSVCSKGKGPSDLKKAHNHEVILEDIIPGYDIRAGRRGDRYDEARESEDGRRRRKGMSVGGVFLTIFLVAALGGIVWKRQVLYERFPIVQVGVDKVKGVVRMAMPGLGRSTEYASLAEQDPFMENVPQAQYSRIPDQ